MNMTMRNPMAVYLISHLILVLVLRALLGALGTLRIPSQDRNAHPLPAPLCLARIRYHPPLR
jgi:hypothetical protein